MPAIHLQARWVCPVDRPPIKGGVVSIEGERIVGVGEKPPSKLAAIDLGDVALFPGLVNAHTHLEFSDLSEPLGQPGMRLCDWVRHVIASRKRTSRDSTQAIRQGIVESIRQGVTSLGEIATAPLSAYRGTELSHLVAFQEVIGFSSARKDSILADVRRQFAKPEAPPLQAGEGDLHRGLSPHAPYTVHPKLVAELVGCACQWQVPIAMHLAESPEELELLARGTGPFRDLLEDRGMWDAGAIPPHTKPLDYLQQLALAPRSLIIHGNYLSGDEIAFLAERRKRMTLVYCPRTHSYFEHPPYPLREMISAGIRVALGTDSRASNPDLSLLGEMRHVAQHHPQVTPAEIFAMGTIAGATSLGLSESIGSLTPGKFADMIAVPCGATNSPLEEILYTTTQPACVYLRGHRRVGSQ